MSYLETMFSLEGKTAIISGGAGAIGLVMSEALLQAGANIVVWSRSQESIDSALDHLLSINNAGERVRGDRIDAGDEAQVKNGLAAAAQQFGSVELLINGVGGNIGKSSFIETDMETFQKVLHMNLVAGLMVPTKILCSYWIENNLQGSIINITSMASYNPLSGVWAYDAAKSATLNLTMASANEFASHGIRVNAIAPGFFLGKQNKALLVDQETGEYTERGKAVIAHTPYGRFGDVAELAGATLFLASEKASGFVTGVSIPVDGGYLVHNI
ncbi:MAG: SDR family oxidoreductase [Desulfobulbaceae bacterium]|nr:MAG: SDR family oxidoreductase [Desulfobulbaceae bacterium]